MLDFVITDLLGFEWTFWEIAFWTLTIAVILIIWIASELGKKREQERERERRLERIRKKYRKRINERYYY